MTRRVLVGICYALSIALLLALAGCLSSKQLYEEAASAREAAYQRWKNRKQQPEPLQTYISGRLSLEDCLKLALVNNKTLQRVFQEKEIARGERLKSHSAILPSVGLSADYLRKDEIASLGPITFGDLDNYSVGLTVNQPIFAGGSIMAKLKAGKLFYLLTNQTVRAAVQDTVYAAEHAYYDVLLNQHLFEIGKDAVRSAQAHLDNVELKRQGGVASDFDLLRAQVELSNYQAWLIQNKNAINIAKANLLKVMGVSQDSNVTLSDELVYTPSTITMEEAVEVAYQNRPDLFGREFDLQYQQELLKIFRSWYWPVISAFYSNTWSNPDPHSPIKIEWGHAWQAGLTAVLPIFDGFAREGNIIQQKARLKQAQINLVDSEETALFELTKAMVSIENAKEFVESQHLNLSRAREGLRLAEVRYKEGIDTQVETIDAQLALTTAGANYYDAIYSHVIAKLDLQKAMGALTTFEPAGPEDKAKHHESITAEKKRPAALAKVEQEQIK